MGNKSRPNKKALNKYIYLHFATQVEQSLTLSAPVCIVGRKLILPETEKSPSSKAAAF